jgi:myo-inositol 2-dehydrogenase / D-chiro-inositol 1-dehydrogenase
MSERSSHRISRREFIGTTAGAGLMILKPEAARGTSANSAIRLGLLGCGGRGTVDAVDCANNAHARVVALADLFRDQLDAARLRFNDLARSRGHAEIHSSQLFLGPKSYEQIAASKDVDALIIATPPYFHPQHLETAVKAGKHVYCEKPVAVDVRGAKRVAALGKEVQNRLSLDVGLQIRSAPPFVELVRQIRQGALGQIASGEAYYYATALERPTWPKASPAERRIRNWIYDRVLSGDIIVEQDVHVIDLCNWILNTPPMKATGAGGRIARTDPGNAWGHFNVVFYYPQGVHVSFSSTQFEKAWWDVNVRFFGSKGVSESPYSGTIAIYGDGVWKWPGPYNTGRGQPKGFSASGVFHDNLADADKEKHKAFIESIESGKFHNQVALGVESALTAILGRTAAYTGREITWQELLDSDETWEADIDLEGLEVISKPHGTP